MSPQVRRALAEFYRVLQSGGLLLLSFHLGQECRHVDELFGQPVALDVLFFERPVVEGWVEEAGFLLQAHLERHPYTPHEGEEPWAGDSPHPSDAHV